MKTKECENHNAVKSHDRCYAGGDVSDCPAAAGNITRTEICSCGASRTIHINQQFATEWTEWTDSDPAWWIGRNAFSVRSCLSDPNLADEWITAIQECNDISILEDIRIKARAGKKITLYQRVNPRRPVRRIADPARNGRGGSFLNQIRG